MPDYSQLLKQYKVIPVIEISDQIRALPLAELLIKNQLPVAEITLRTSAALSVIEIIHKHYPELLLIAGTVTSPELAEKAIQAGAQVIVSPGFNSKTVKYCQLNNFPIIPGIATPSDIEQALNYGINFVKFFPAEANGGLNTLKAVSGPYKDMKFMPTGGIQPNNILDYLSLNNVVCCGGTWFVNSQLINQGGWEELNKLIYSAYKLTHG